MFSGAVKTINGVSLNVNKVESSSTNKCVYNYPGPFKKARKYAQDTMSGWVESWLGR